MRIWLQWRQRLRPADLQKIRLNIQPNGNIPEHYKHANLRRLPTYRRWPPYNSNEALACKVMVVFDLGKPSWESHMRYTVMDRLRVKTDNQDLR